MLDKINHTQVSNDFIDNWMNKLTPAETVIFIAVCRKTIGWRKDTDRISYSQLIKMTGLTTNTIKKSIKRLTDTHRLLIQESTPAGYVYEVNYNVSNFDTEGCQILIGGVSNFDMGGVSNFDTTKETITKETIKKNYQKKDIKTSNENIIRAIALLNLLTMRQYSATNQNTVKLLTSLLKTYSIDDIEMVIKHKVNDWKGKKVGDFDGDKYLRPETLFSGKFHNYYESAKNAKLVKPVVKYNTPHTAAYNKLIAGTVPDSEFVATYNALNGTEKDELRHMADAYLIRHPDHKRAAV